MLGWRIDATGEVVINPVKTHQIHLHRNDQVLLVGRRAPSRRSGAADDNLSRAASAAGPEMA
jgi:hypothetical protein